MPAFHYKTEEGHQRHLEKRRAYYQKNKERIRERDNASAHKRREQDPEKYRETLRKQAEKQRAKAPVRKSTNLPSLHNHPDKNRILEALNAESVV